MIHLEQDTEGRLDEYCDHVDLILTRVALREGLLLSENFSRKNFSEMVDHLGKLESLVPEKMVNTLRSIHRAINQVERDYAAVIRGRITKEKFSRSVAQTKGLVGSIAGALEELHGILSSRKLKYAVANRLGRKSSVDNSGQTLADVLDSNHRDIVKARIEQGFEQPSNVVGKVWKSVSPGSYGWHGLTDSLLVDDIMGLGREDLQRLGSIDTTVLDDLFPHSSISGEDVESTKDPTQALIHPEDQETSDPASTPSEDVGSEESISVNELIARFGTEELTDKQKKVVGDMLKKVGLRIRESYTPQDLEVLSRWRRLAGISSTKVMT